VCPGRSLVVSGVAEVGVGLVIRVESAQGSARVSEVD
jgi:hypothetical protein